MNKICLRAFSCNCCMIYCTSAMHTDLCTPFLGSCWCTCKRAAPVSKLYSHVTGQQHTFRLNCRVSRHEYFMLYFHPAATADTLRHRLVLYQNSTFRRVGMIPDTKKNYIQLFKKIKQKNVVMFFGGCELGK